MFSLFFLLTLGLKLWSKQKNGGEKIKRKSYMIGACKWLLSCTLDFPISELFHAHQE